MRTSRTCLVAVALATGLLTSRAALAQTPSAPAPTLPQGTAGLKSASTGSTEVVTGKVAAAADKPADAKDETTVTLGAGGLFLGGNSRQFALTGRFDMKLRREVHQFGASVAGNFARAGKAGEGTQPSAENVQGLARYDWFFADRWSLFGQMTARYDRFQGLDLRLNFDPGVAFYFVVDPKQKLWIEVGYDGQYDIRRDEFIAASATPVEKTRYLNNARIFVGYNNKVYDNVGFLADVEYLQDFASADTYRLIFDAGLNAKVANRFVVSVTATVRYENRPLPNVQNTDTQGAVNLVYTLL